MDNVIDEVNVIKKDIDDVNDKCSKIQCLSLYDSLNAFLKLIYDILKCFKPKTN